MDSQVELVAFTKGIEYLLAIAFVILFVAFWQLMYGERAGLLARAGRILYLAVFPVLVAVTCLATVPR